MRRIRQSASLLMILSLALMAGCSNSLLNSVINEVSRANAELDMRVRWSDGDIPAEATIILPTTSVGTTSETVFTVRNLSLAPLVLAENPTVVITGTDRLFIEQPSTTYLESDESITFIISFDPAAEGIVNGTVAVSTVEPEVSTHYFHISATGIESEIAVRKGASEIISSGETTDLGSIEVGYPLDIDFAVDNGDDNAELLLTADPPVTIVPDAGVPDDIEVLVQPGTSIGPHGSESFTLRFLPTEERAYSATVVIPNTDLDEDPYTFEVTATAVNPDISLVAGGETISSGDDSPVYLGSCVLGGAEEWDLTVENNGVGRLFLTGSPRVTLTGSDASLFAVTSLPTTPVASGGTTTLGIEFTPDSTGTKYAVVNVDSNDPDTPTYIALISADVTLADILIQKDGVTLPHVSGSVDFGTVPMGNGATVTFEILSQGTGDVLLDWPIVEVVDTEGFNRSSWPTTILAPGEDTEFGVTFSPMRTGAFSTTVNVHSNDPDTPIYTFTVTGTGEEYHGCKAIDTSGYVGSNTSIATAGDNVYISYQDYTNYKLKFARSSNGGATWTKAFVDNTVKSGYDTSLAVADGVIYMSARIESGAESLRFYRSDDGGVSWTIRTVDAPDGQSSGHDSQIAVSGSTVYIAYQKNYYLDSTYTTEIMLATSTDGGSTWTTKTIGTGWYTSIAVSGNDVYLAFNNSAGLNLAHSSDSGTTFSIVTLDSGTSVSRQVSIDEDNGDLYIAYYDNSNDNLKSAVYNSVLEEWTYTTVDTGNPSGDGDTGWYANVDYEDGVIYISYHHESMGYTDMNNLNLAVSDDEGETWTYGTVETGGNYGSHSDLTVSGSRVFISHAHGTNQYDLRFCKSLDGGLTW